MLLALRSRLNAWISDPSIQRLLKNTSLLFGAESIVTLISLIQFPIISRWLGPENYGLWGLAQSWVGLVGQLFGFRLWETVIKFLSQFMAAKDETRALAVLKLCFFLEALVAAFIFLVLVLSADFAGSFVFRSFPGGADLIRLETLHILMLFSSSIWVAVLRVFDRFKKLSLYNVVFAIAQFGLWMLIVKLNAGLGGLILAGILVKFFQTLTLAWIAQRELRKRFGRHWFTADLNALRGYRREIGVMLFSMNVDTLRKIAMGNADMLVIGWLTNPTQVGIYRLAKQLALYFGRVTNPIYESLYPEVTRLYAAEGAIAVRKFVRRLMGGVLAGLAAALAGAYLLAPWLIPPIFGSEYILSIPLFYVIMLTNLWVVGLWIPSVMLSAGQARRLTLINTISSLVMLSLLLVFVYLWGAWGAALALISFHLTWLLLAYPAARRALTGPEAKPA